MKTPETEELKRLENELKTIHRMIAKEGKSVSRYVWKQGKKLGAEIRRLTRLHKQDCAVFEKATRALVKSMENRAGIVRNRIAVLTGRAAK